MGADIDTDVVNGAAAARATEDHPSLSTLSAILDVVRPPGQGLRVLEVASEAWSLATLASPDEVVSLDGSERVDPAPVREDAYDCAVAIDAVHRLEPVEQRLLLKRLRRAARAAVLVEAPLPNGACNPFQEAIDLFRGLGDSIVVLGPEHLPTLFAMHDTGLGGEPAGRSAAGDKEAAASRSVLVSIIDPHAVGVELSKLRRGFALPDVGGHDRTELAVLSLSVEIRRLSERLDGERLRRDRAEAEGVDLRAKVGELTRVTSEERAARRAAEEHVEIIAAARGYRIGLALYRARATMRDRVSGMARALTAPWRAAVRRLRRRTAAPDGL